MGKESRQSSLVRRSLDDARALLRIADSIEGDEMRLDVAPAERHMGGIMQAMRSTWERLGPVVLRADPDLVGALLSTDRDTEIGRQWLGRMRFDCVALTFAEPIRIHDGDNVCVYRGFFASGVVSKPRPGVRPPQIGDGLDEHAEAVWTTYHPFGDADDVRILWLLEYEGHPNLRGGQTMTLPLHNQEKGPRTIAQFIDRLNRAYGALGHGEDDAGILTPLGLLLLMYLSSSEPDLSEVDPGTDRRGAPPDARRRKAPRVINLGLRVGGAVRGWRRAGAGGRGKSTGWHLPPHIRAAHWRRSRIARRDDASVIVGDVHGEEGVDWDYVWHWIPPTPVNVTAEGPAPAVRQLTR